MKPARISTLFYLGLMAMELSYLYVLASLFSGPTYSLILMLLLYPLALFSKLVLPRAVFSRQLKLVLGVALVTLVIALVAGERLVSSLATGQADVAGIILRIGFCGLIWLMGYTVPHQRVNYVTIALRLQIGVLAMLVFAQVTGSAPPVFLFFVLAPLALFLARWASSISRGATALRSPKLSHLLLGGAVVIVPGTAITLLFSPDVARAIVDWLENISMKISDWVMAQYEPATPSSGFKFDFGCNMQPESGGTSPSTPTLPPAEGTSGTGLVVFWVILSVILLAIVALIVFSLRRRKAKRKAKAQPAEPAPFQIRMVSISMFRSLLSLFPQLVKKLWLWLTSLFQKWKKRPKPSEEVLTSIRALYRNLLRWAAKQGIARLPSQTPLEHLVLLEQRSPQQQDDLKQFTEAYLVARYSRKPVFPEEFDSAKKAWQRVVAYHTPCRC
jgi:hypothetical protein